VSTPQLRGIEDLDIFTPLGLRFWDSALDRAIDEGLRVVARPWHSLEREILATRNRSGVHTFRWLPGMSAVEYHQAESHLSDTSIPRQRPFIVTVEDQRERFLPAAFRIDLPLPYRGIFLAEGSGSTPGGSQRGVYLFSAPTRRVDERLTAVRGTLADAVSGEPIPWAHVVVRAPHARTFHGLADAQGRFVVMFPYPSLAEGFQGSTGSFGHGTPIGARGWDISVEVRAQPGVLGHLPATRLPEYRSIFEQVEAELWTSLPDPSVLPEARLDLHLPFGQQLTVRTHTLSVQLVTAAAPSP
jgi:hypothetical protein